MSRTGKALSAALERTNEWTITEHSDGIVFTINHLPSDTSWWTANGAWFFDRHDQPGKYLGFIERHYLFRKARRLIINPKKHAIDELLKSLNCGRDER